MATRTVPLEITAGHRETDIHARRRRINPRLIAPLAFLIAFTAVALEIAYTIGRFVNQTAAQIR